MAIPLGDSTLLEGNAVTQRSLQGNSLLQEGDRMTH
jgi:hypothetical protein